MSKISHYIVHQCNDVTLLKTLVNNSISEGYHPFGNLSTVLAKVDMAGNPSKHGVYDSIVYIQPMVRFSN